MSRRSGGRFASWMNESIPLLLTAFGPKGLVFAGGVFGDVILHTFLSDDATTP